MKKMLSFVLFVGISFSAYTQTEFRLVSEGKANYDIVISPSASPVERFASEELASYLKQMSGTTFAVKTSPARTSIFVGTAASIGTFYFGIPGTREPEQFGIFTFSKNIFLTGGDQRGVLFAVYGFLHELGCRWIAPDYDFFEGSSSHIPSLPNLTYHHQKDILDKPEMKYRKLYVEEGRSHNTENLLQLIDWMPKLRYNTLVIPTNYQGHDRVKWDNWRERLTPELQKRGITIEVGGHGYENFLNAEMENGKLFELHPEWFGMDKDGKRSTNKRFVFCTSNQDAVHYLQNNVINYLKTHPEIEIFDFWPPDVEQWCNCPECSKTSPEQRHFELVNQMAKALKEQLPKVKLECLAYSKYVTPPEGVTLDPSVLLDFCPITQNYQTQFYEKENAKNIMYDESLRKWLNKFKGDISIYSYYRKYRWNSLPNVFPHYIQNELKYFRKIGVKGISIYSEPGDWFAYGPNYYVLGYLAQHPDADVDALMSDYTQLLYGPATEVMTTVYWELEDIVRNGCYFAESEFFPLERYDDYYERVARIAGLVGKARIKYGTENRVLDKHLNRVELMLEYVSKSIRRQQEAARENRQSFQRLTDELKNFFRENAGKGIFVE